MPTTARKDVKRVDESNSFPGAGSCAARREVVRVAEQTVSDAWMELLILAQQEAEITVAACRRACEELAERLLEAKGGSDLRTLTETQERFAQVVYALDKALDDQEQAQQIWAEEAEEWASCTERRLQEAEDDQHGEGG